MPTNTRDIFTTLTTEGALLPPDILQRIADGDESLEGLSPQAYHQYGRLNEATNFVWNRLQGFWQAFQSARAKLPEGDAGTSLTRERWLLPLFDLLGYGRLDYISSIEHEGQRFSISHQWRRVPINLIGCNSKLDERSKQGSPHSQVQVLLNRDDSFLWGFLSNGLRLRILRDNISLTRQAYIEFDLESMMEGEVYSDFVLLYLLCHQSRVEAENPADYWLEQWRKTAEAQGKRALDELRDGVERAITHLGTGFLEHPQNIALRDALQTGALDKQDYYRQLLRLVYRLLFLFVAEDRNLLHLPSANDAQRKLYHFYSSQRLREVAANLRGTRHHDLYESLRIVMQLLGGVRSGAEGLGLPILGSFLFEDAAMPDIIAAKIANRDLLEAIRAISSIEDSTIHRLRRVDFKNLGSEELGSVYESLLELHPEIENRRFRLDSAGGNERKTTGSYYTPTSLINALLDSALDPVLDEAAKKGESAILALKICDPACGSGHFLIATAHRIAKRLAQVQTGEDEPTPAAVNAAKREVIAHCIYGVDINPMAVELCKVNLWLESIDPGKPLSFLDHRIQVGNSLLGTTPALMAKGIPDEAFSPIEGDDKAFVSTMKKLNKKEREQRKGQFGNRQLGLFDDAPSTDYRALSRAMHELDAIPDSTLEGIRRKAAYYAALANDPNYTKARLLADAWCAAFVWEKHPHSKSLSQGARDFNEQSSEMLPSTLGRRAGDEGFPMPLTDLLYRRLERDPLAENLASTRATIIELAQQYLFFHWHIAFPDVFIVDSQNNNPPSPKGRGDGGEGLTGWGGGFDVLLGNPPWEQIQLDDREFFAAKAPDIAEAANMTVRKKMIDKLAKTDTALYQEYLQAVRANDGIKHFSHASGRYPLTSFGRLNSAPLFCELGLTIINPQGFTALIVPTGIATDSFNQYFFNHIVDSRALVSLYDFENRQGLFAAVDSRMKFCILTLSGKARIAVNMRFLFFAHQVSDLADNTFILTAEDIALLNPNTRTTPIFRSKRDAELTKAIYHRTPILMKEPDTEENIWGIRFMLMFMMNTDSDKFRTREELELQGFELKDNYFNKGNEVYLPLYEAKMMHQFNHRWATYTAEGDTRDISLEELQDPNTVVIPRYWIEEKNVEAKIGNTPYMIGFRDIARATDERTAIMGLIPKSGVGNTAPIIMLNRRVGQYLPILISDEQLMKRDAGLLANICSFGFDYVVRQKISTTHLNFYVVEQLPVLPPHSYTQALLDFIVPRVLELTYTAWDLQPFAQDIGYQGAPFIWDEERRFLLRCELDALYFHLYQISREDVDYIMETFPIVKRKDEAAHGRYRTKDTILAMFDEMSQLPSMSIPAPKGAGDYIVPNVSQWNAATNPPPADASVAHKDSRE